MPNFNFSGKILKERIEKIPRYAGYAKLGNRAVPFAEFKESALDLIERRQDEFRGDFQPLFIGSLTETNVDHAGSPAIGPRWISQPADVIRC